MLLHPFMYNRQSRNFTYFYQIDRAKYFTGATSLLLLWASRSLSLSLLCFVVFSSWGLLLFVRASAQQILQEVQVFHYCSSALSSPVVTVLHISMPTNVRRNLLYFDILPLPCRTMPAVSPSTATATVTATGRSGRSTSSSSGLPRKRPYCRSRPWRKR